MIPRPAARGGVIAGILLAGVTAASALPEVDGLLALLAERGFAVDTNRVREAAVRAVLRAVDPYAEILDRDQARRIEKAHWGYVPAVTSLTSTGTAAEVATNLVRRASSDAVEEWPERIRYLRVRGFFEGSDLSLPTRVRAWSKQGAFGVILDLRGAGGYNLRTTDLLAGLFVGKGDLLYSLETLAGDRREEHRAEEEGVLGVHLMVLVDRRTVEAPEILAALLQGRPGVVLLGESTRGDATLREMVPYGEDEALFLASKRVRLANGRDYAGEGVVPDVFLGGARHHQNARAGRTDRGGHPLSRTARLHRELFERVGDDAVLGGAIDVLLALRATGTRRTDREGP